MNQPRLSVLESFQQPRATTNPYITMLYQSLQQACDVTTFSWRAALTGTYTVFHVHWPEVLLASPRRSKRIARRIFFSAFLLRLKLRRVAIVRTMHNVAPHETPSRVDRALIERLDRMTTSWIRLNRMTEVAPGSDVTTILLGHYLDWFKDLPQESAQPKRIGNFGLIRPYKGVSELVDAFRESNDPDLQLVIMGEPSTPELAGEITRRAAGDPRIVLNLEHVDDATLATEILRSAVVALPHRNMHNSSSLVLALSLDRPALVPRTQVTEDIRTEVGPEWIYIYDGDLSGADLERAATLASTLERGAHPDLSQRDWGQVAARHVEVFRHAMAKVSKARS